MIRLHLLGFTRDLKGLVFSGKRGGKTGTYWVTVDETMVRAVEQLQKARQKEEDKQTHSQAAKQNARTQSASKTASKPAKLAVTDTQDLPLPRPPVRVAKKSDSKLTPREIQQYLRDGRSVKDVAALAGVGPEWIERFIGPVLEERAGVIQLTQRAKQSRARLGMSGIPIGEAVKRNLEERRATSDTMDNLDEGWEARRRGTGVWRVRLKFSHRGRKQTAEWEFRKDTGAVRPFNAMARQLGWCPAPEPPVRRRVADDPDAAPDASVERAAGAPAPQGAAPRRRRPASRPRKKAAQRRRPAAKRARR